MIFDREPTDWSDLQNLVAQMFREAGCEVAIGQEVALVRGKKAIDVLVRDQQTTPAAAAILKALAQGGGVVPLNKLAKQANMHAAKVHRYLTSLTRSGLVTQNRDSGYSLPAHHAHSAVPRARARRPPLTACRQSAAERGRVRGDPAEDTHAWTQPRARHLAAWAERARDAGIRSSQQARLRDRRRRSSRDARYRLGRRAGASTQTGGA